MRVIISCSKGSVCTSWAWAGCGGAVPGAGHSTVQGTQCPGDAQLPELQPDSVGCVSADHRCLTHYSLLHPKLGGKMSFPHVVPSADLLCVGSAPCYTHFLHFTCTSCRFPRSELSKGSSALHIRGRVPVLVHSPVVAPLYPWAPLISAPVRRGLQHQH